MNLILAGLTWQCCLVYIDDVIIYSATFEQHLLDITAVFQRLDKANLRIKLSKCQWAKPSVIYLSHVISGDGIAPDPRLIKSVVEWPVPTNSHDLHSFLGLASWYRRFVKDFARIAGPLFKLISKTAIFNWTDEHQQTFQLLKDKLVSAPILACPDFSLPFILQCDASDYALGAILSQVKEAREHVIAYISRGLNKHEKNYSTTDKECLAVYWAVKTLRPYLFGRHFTVITDHQALKYLFSIKDPVKRPARWSYLLQAYDFEIQHRSGTNHYNVDALSRLPSSNTSESIPSTQHSSLVAAAKSDSSKPKQYEVEKVIDKRIVDGKVEYLLHWKGYQSSDDSWEPAAGLDCDKLIDEYESSVSLPASSDNIHDTERKQALDNVDHILRDFNQFFQVYAPNEQSQPSAPPPTDSFQFGPNNQPSDPSSQPLLSPNDLLNSSNTLEEFQLLQQQDPYCATVISKLNGESNPNPLSQSLSAVPVSDYFTLKDGLLYHLWQPTNPRKRGDLRLQLIIPASVRSTFLSLLHDDIFAGHLGANRTYEKLRERYYLAWYVQRC